ncbi:MAG: NUDIX hydrolase [Ignavibacteria bacterium]|nr:NUDIX hydrolase [Ignavibacteria bacterium]
MRGALDVIIGSPFSFLSRESSMPLKKWNKLSESVKFKNSWWTYKVDEFSLSDDLKGEYHYVHTNGASMIVPVLNDGRIVMINQYRYLCEKESLEFPCGGVKEGCSYDETALDELAEEAGYAAREWQIAGEFNPFNGITDEICCVYIARHLSPAEKSPDLTEEFERIILQPDEIDARIISGVIWDGMTIAGWTIAKTFIHVP